MCLFTFMVCYRVGVYNTKTEFMYVPVFRVVAGLPSAISRTNRAEFVLLWP